MDVVSEQRFKLRILADLRDVIRHVTHAAKSVQCDDAPCRQKLVLSDQTNTDINAL